jgi:hypothetical protein
MNWIHFLLWLAGIYFLYYLIVVLLDVSIGKRPQAAGASGYELTFSGYSAPQDAAQLLNEKQAQTTAAIAAQSTPEMIASGGVPLKDVFSLARKEAIVYLKEVAFN